MTTNLPLTAYHAKYYAHEITKKNPSHSIEKLASTFVDAQIDLNPHQVDAALFAFSNPLSMGAILADEVGLGKTIEAGLIISQKWAERKRKIVIICPASLRKQWNQELADKFFIPSVILENKSLQSFDPSIDGVIICSYQFARAKEQFFVEQNWHLCILDEAHRLRNVYRSDNRIGKAIQRTFRTVPKVLLTATPLQNSLMELYGLVSIIDPHVFGDQRSFKSQYQRVEQEANEDAFQDLRDRLRPICKRTLRSDVLEYINYTNRISIVETYHPSDDEQQLYEMISEYLRRPSLNALPSGQRHLITLVLRKLLASSSFAITRTLGGLIGKLEGKTDDENTIEIIQEEYDDIPDLEEEWEDDNDDPFAIVDNPNDELAYLKTALSLAQGITKNAKGEKLMTALNKGFTELARLGGQRKALIFTESTRTQAYLKEILESNGFAGKIVLFNGSNADPSSKEVYQAWMSKHAGTDRITGAKSADMRAALVEYFRDNAEIMIATEAAAEGINLQFCSLIVNYDLPWNPQRIEQRIGRCHRYGQKVDVVVVNFLNENNAADQRVFELLTNKFRLFEGVFGASDDVLGVIESGVDFEKRIAQIYQECRTKEEIESAFNRLQDELEHKINETKAVTKVKLLENFDLDVANKLRIRDDQSKEYLSVMQRWLWDMTRFYLQDSATFSEQGYSFELTDNPYPDHIIHPGPYRIGKNIEDANIYRIGHELAQLVIKDCMALDTPTACVTFDLSNSGVKISTLDPHKGQEGYLSAFKLSVSSLEVEEHIVFFGVDWDGTIMDEETCRHLFNIPAINIQQWSVDQMVTELITDHNERQQETILKDINGRNSDYFGSAIDKLDKWADDKQKALRDALTEIDKEIKDLKNQSRKSGSLPERLAMERKIRDLGVSRDEAWREYDVEAKNIIANKDALIDDIASKLDVNIETEELFIIKWKIV